MTCIKCPHSAEIESFKAWQNGGRSGPSPITDNRRKELFDICRECGVRASARNGWGDTFEHRGQSQVMLIEDALTGSDEDGSLYSARDGYWESRTRDTSVGCTLLDPATEDTLRVALATIFSNFDPVEVLLLRHIMSGATAATFYTTLRDLRDRLGKYELEGGHRFQALAHSWAARMKRIFPPIEGVLNHNRTQSADGGLLSKTDAQTLPDGRQGPGGASFWAK